MMEAGASLLLQTIDGLIKGSLKETPQPQQQNITLHHAPKIFTETCEINWEKIADDIYNLIRGLSPYPAAFTFLKEKKIKIFKAEIEIISPREKPGEFITDNKTFLKFACTNGYVYPKLLQLEGKKKMQVEDFLRGWKSN